MVHLAHRLRYHIVLNLCFLHFYPQLFLPFFIKRTCLHLRLHLLVCLGVAASSVDVERTAKRVRVFNQTPQVIFFKS